MRQGQQQNRQRSRNRGNNRNNNNSNRNQLNRSMESNGPDVRIRGTAAHIAEKYMQLARDAQTSGDTVAAESYWQFAEHYNRLIATAQAAQAEEQAKRDEEQAKREEERTKRAEEFGSDEGEGAREERGRGRGRIRGRKERPVETAGNSDAAGEGPQPVLTDTPAEIALDDGNGEEAPAPRKARRPRKKVEPEAGGADEAAPELPAFISGAAE